MGEDTGIGTIKVESDSATRRSNQFSCNRDYTEGRSLSAWDSLFDLASVGKLQRNLQGQA